MKISYKLNADLPPLAWAANCKDGSVEVIHGNQVECCDSFFVDGAWNGEFIKGNFHSSDWFCGTGGRLFDDKIIFSTPSYINGGIYVADFLPRGGSNCFKQSLSFDGIKRV